MAPSREYRVVRVGSRPFYAVEGRWAWQLNSNGNYVSPEEDWVRIGRLHPSDPAATAAIREIQKRQLELA
jgi:hypothetical protein